MKRKQLLIVLLSFVVVCAAAVAAGSQLTGVNVASEGNVTTVTIRANGAFTHTEYRPVENLLMVDLAGVSAAKLDGKSESLGVAGISSYRVIGFKGANGSDVARVEFTVNPNATVKFSDVEGGVQLRVLSQKPAPPASQMVLGGPEPEPLKTVAVTAVKPKPVVVEEEESTPHQRAKLALPVQVRAVNVARGADGMEVQINSSGPITPEAMKLENPDRLVVDLPNAMWDRAPKQIPVNAADVKSVRMALYQINPPVTRVVLDLAEARDYELVPFSTGVRVKLHPASAAAASPAAQPVPAKPVLMQASASQPAMAQPASSAAALSAPAQPTPAAPQEPAPVITRAADAPVLTPARIKPAEPTPVAAPKISTQASVPALVAPKPAEPVAGPAPVIEKAMDRPIPSPAWVKPPAPEPMAAPQLMAKTAAPALPAPAPAPVVPPPAPKPAPVVVAAAAAPATPAALPGKAATAVTTSSPAAAPASAAAPAANEYVVVEPAYKPKVEDSPKAEEPKLMAAASPAPLIRATDAAARFAPAEKAVPLVAGTHSAAMQAAAGSAPQMSQAQAVPQAQPATAPRPKYTGEPISVNLKDVDLKDFFRLIHEISGLNVVLDPNVRGSLTLVLDDVPWDQALDIVLKNNGLERELDGNVLRIATVDTLRREADARRAQVEARSLADPKITVTRFLSYAHSRDVVPIVKKFLSQRGEIISDDRTNGLIIQDIPSVFPEIDRLLTQLDRKTPEVEIEARVIAATRSFARDIGTQLGFVFGNNASFVGGAPQVGSSPIGGSSSSGGGSGSGSGSGSSSSSSIPFLPPSITSGIPLFSNLQAVGATSGAAFSNIGSNYRVDAILTLAESKGLLKILSRPRVVTQNNIQAVVRQGVRIPIVTQAQLGGPPTTTYVDAFLRLTVTPQITIENTIFLNVDVENTVPDFGHVSPLTGNPTLLTQQATTQVLVTDGGMVVIGGVMQTNNSVTVQQVPLLGNIPALGNLFKRRAVQTQTQELFFFITPKIIQT